jgi:anti-anti-sigma factor
MATFSDEPLEIARQDQEVMVHVKEQKILDESVVQIIREPLLKLAENQTGGVLTMNLKDVEYLGSAMLETLISTYRTLKTKGGRLVLRNLQPQVYEVFEVTKLHELFEIHKEKIEDRK